MRTNKWACLVTPHSSQVHTHVMVMFRPPSHHIVSLTPFSHAPENTCVLLPILPFYPFPPLDLNLSINNFYVASTGGVCGVIGSLNFKFQVSNRIVKTLKSSRLLQHKLCGCCIVSPQKLFALLKHMRGLTCHDLSFEMQLFIDGTEVFLLWGFLLIILTPLVKRLWSTKNHSACSVAGPKELTFYHYFIYTVNNPTAGSRSKPKTMS